ncbi:unnamed protein product [Paramecium pentaurelia]|uniref:Uncharacterized protein n=1 Tax=Paramecium pentaurelia TaxID=43138 RepID=A0A8S1WRL6_9CILI|nr:unnamed protein product [Paramecium pentaurelia]
MNRLKKYLECDDDQVLDIYDQLIDEILQHQNEQEQLILNLRDHMQLVDIKKKIRILQLINEIICCNDTNFKSLIQIHFLDLLKEYFEHQSKSLQSNYLCQEDEVEVIELYMFVNKILAYYDTSKIEKPRLSIMKPKSEEFKFQFESRASIFLNDQEQKYEEKEIQTDEDQELIKWKNKWELQFHYNQRLQKINSQLRKELVEYQKKYNQTSYMIEKPHSAILLQQPTKSKETLTISFGQQQLQSQSQQLMKFEDDEEDQIIISDINESNDQTNQIKQISSILKKNENENEKKQKKRVQFVQRKLNIQCYNYQNLLNELEQSELLCLKKCCFSKYGIIYDDRSIQILLQLSDSVEFESCLTILNRTNDDIKLSLIYKQPVNINLRIKDLILNSKKSLKQVIYNDKDELLQLQLHYELHQQKIDKYIIIPNLLHKYLQFNKFTETTYQKHMDEIKNNDTHTMLICQCPNINVDEDKIMKIIPNYIHIKNKYLSSMNYKSIQFYCKIKCDKNSTEFKLLIDSNNEQFGTKLLQQLIFLLIIQKK